MVETEYEMYGYYGMHVCATIFGFCFGRHVLLFQGHYVDKNFFQMMILFGMMFFLIKNTKM